VTSDGALWRVVANPSPPGHGWDPTEDHGPALPLTIGAADSAHDERPAHTSDTFTR